MYCQFLNSIKRWQTCLNMNVKKNSNNRHFHCWTHLVIMGCSHHNKAYPQVILQKNNPNPNHFTLLIPMFIFPALRTSGIGKCVLAVFLLCAATPHSDFPWDCSGLINIFLEVRYTNLGETALAWMGPERESHCTRTISPQTSTKAQQSLLI